MTMAVIGAIIIGVSLGMFGSGGAILTIPILMYLLGMSADLAIASSLAIVAGISLGGSVVNMAKGQVSYRHLLWFGVPGMAGTYAGAWLGTMADTRLQLAVFVVLMVIAAAMMWRGGMSNKQRQPSKETISMASVVKLILDGTVVGAIAGFVGVGGGFLIVPALVLLAGLPIVVATSTSLLIIALNSITGFTKYFWVYSENGLSFDWGLIAVMVTGGIAGSYVGRHVGQRLPQSIMQKSFAVFLVGMSSLVLVKSVL